MNDSSSTKPAGGPFSDMADEQRAHVRERYGQAARREGGCCGSGGAAALAATLGYGEDELAGLPEGANLGLSCGNPVELASLQPGESVLDLGSGAGFDCFVAGRVVGAQGRVIGVDMTPEMIARARSGCARYRELTGWDNVEFRLGEIEHLPVADASVDVVISNCVLNLSPEKAQVWREIARVLRPGGRVAVSDMALLRPLPESVATDLRALSACIAGAVTVDAYREQVESAGLTGVRVASRDGGRDVWEHYDDPLLKEIRRRLPEGTVIGDHVASVDVRALKPASSDVAQEAPPGGSRAAGGCCA